MTYHRCRMCGCIWVQFADSGRPDGWWSMVSPTCEKCCDNSADFLTLIDPLSEQDILTLLREGERFRAQLALYGKASGKS